MMAGDRPVAAESAPATDKYSATTDSMPRASRTKRPNYAQIHARPLPFEVYPLPAFVPHNPLSLVRIAIALISSSIWPKQSLVVVHKAYFSPETLSIHVTDPVSVRNLWEQGFWGSGSLSRSEPRWLDQEKRKRGIKAALTSEEFTRQRREERRQFKLERARQEREAIEQQLLKESKENPNAAIITPNDAAEISEDIAIELNHTSNGTAIVTKTAVVVGSVGTEASPLEPEMASEDLEEEIEDQEHLQLTFEEAFFLSYALGVLGIYNLDASETHSREHLADCLYLLRLFCAYSTFPLPRNTERHIHGLQNYSPTISGEPLQDQVIRQPIASDNPFLLKYVVFHHFRSLGWVVRPGIKFAVDYLLYNRGPAFSHAEFAVMIIPSYSHSYWSETEERKAGCKAKENKDWWWLHRVNRVQSQVHKTLVLVYVDVPPPWDDGTESNGIKVDIGKVLKQYKVREFVLRRWTPNRNRD